MRFSVASLLLLTPTRALTPELFSAFMDQFKSFGDFLPGLTSLPMLTPEYSSADPLAVPSDSEAPSLFRMPDLQNFMPQMNEKKTQLKDMWNKATGLFNLFAGTP
eukprot:Gregarina_sp_Poly_1__7827@NODE_4435_length_598_cov_4_764595_g2962_i0_p1_GENE_NODE_4435_length_598_cov_4_764595_g2962_i0NODE_4435_length_598_cov_4_764595_g2962_i0_p1_ORF_typecomplete_len105_score17_15_NODE_4435_length_598_cov_4_764595_g2962_i0166480